MTARNFIDLPGIGTTILNGILNDAIRRKQARRDWPRGRPDADLPLKDRVLAMVFEKPSTRTRVSFDMAMRQLGGTTINLGGGELQLGRGETVADTARVLSGYVDAIMIRTSDHAKILELAAHASVPVINGLTDHNHPCQAMADVMTVQERLGDLKATCWAWFGDGNNMANSLIEAAGVFGFPLRLACPEGFDPDAATIDQARGAGASITLTRDPAEAAAGADVIVTDTWISMGQAGSDAKLAAMAPYQVNPALMARASERAVFLHCLPAHRGEEMTADVIDGPRSLVWEEAENRLHIQKAILRWCVAGR